MPEQEQWLRELSSRLAGLENVITAKIDGFRDVMEERDRRYQERDQANKDAVRSALTAAEKASDTTAQALSEYKKGANEWRDTVKDLIAELREARSKGEGSTGAMESRRAAARANLAVIIAFAGLILVAVMPLITRLLK